MLRRSVRAAWLAALLALAAPAPTASAHHVSLCRGTALVHSDRVEIELEVSAEDFLHYYGDEARRLDACTRAWLQSAAQRHESYLADHLILRDAEGERLAVRVVQRQVALPEEEQFDWARLRTISVKYSLRYELRRPAALLGLQQTFGAAAELPSQAVLRISGAGGGPEESVTLTNGGNVAVLELQGEKRDRLRTAEAASADPHARLGALRRFSEMYAVVGGNDRSLQVEFYLPWRVACLWLAGGPGDSEFLSAAQQATAIDQLKALTRRNRLVCGTAEVKPDAVEAAFLRPGERLGEPAAGSPERLSVFTARVVLVLRYSLPAGAPARFTCGLFNSAVPVMPAFLQRGGSLREVRLSTYAPELVLD